jgi:TetR/AcrR family transcriptional repressor of nem operon
MGQPLTTRERLISTGLDLIFARSYGSVSVDDICRKAKVNKGSFYHCFKSKTDLAIAILDAQEAIYLEEILKPAFGGTGPPLEKIADAFRQFAGFQRRVKSRQGRALGCLFGNLALELGTTDRRVRDRVKVGLGHLAAAFERALREAMDRGDIPKGDPAVGAEQLVAFMQGLILWSKVNDDPEKIAALAVGLGSLGLSARHK